jgi:hypothetical protein
MQRKPWSTLMQEDWVAMQDDQTTMQKNFNSSNARESE